MEKRPLSLHSISYRSDISHADSRYPGFRYRGSHYSLRAFVVLLVFCLLGATRQAAAQYADSLAKLKNATPEQRASMQSDLMKTKLLLTDPQYRQVQAVNLLYARKIEPILKSDNSKFSKYGQIKPILEQKDEKLRTIFTKEQFERYGAVKKELMDQARKVYLSNP